MQEYKSGCFFSKHNVFVTFCLLVSLHERATAVILKLSEWIGIALASR